MKTILVIEDTPAMRENIAEILGLAAYQVMQAANGKEGIELARQTRPDLILCDITMPELDGFGVLHILAKDPRLANVPFIFLTAKAEPTAFRMGMDLGADDYITKPFDDLTLLNTVEIRLKKGQRGQPFAPANPPGLATLARAILADADAFHTLCDEYPTTVYRKRQLLFSAGSWPTALYFISKGRGKRFRTDPVGNEYITGLLGPGNFVGYQALLDEVPYAETAELLDDGEVCAIPKADFVALIYSHPDVIIQLARMLTGEITELQERILKLAYQSVRKRVAEALLMVQRKFYPRPDAWRSEGPTDPAGVGEPVWSDRSPPGPGRIADGPESPAWAAGDPVPNTSAAMTLSRENWSHLVGASTETVIRILGDLRDEGLIDIQASQITLLDIDKLARLKR